MTDGFCWCWMCGYNAKVNAKDRERVEDEERCPCCETVGEFSLLDSGDTLNEDVIPDEPTPTFPEMS